MGVGSRKNASLTPSPSQPFERDRADLPGHLRIAVRRLDCSTIPVPQDLAKPGNNIGLRCLAQQANEPGGVGTQ